ncbi:hypothetical protein SNEBB_007579, partial [Seison nebaliae]
MAQIECHRYSYTYLRHTNKISCMLKTCPTMRKVMKIYFSMLYEQRYIMVINHINLWSKSELKLEDRLNLIEDVTNPKSQQIVHESIVGICPFQIFLNFFGMCRWMYMSMISSDMKLNHYFNLTVLFLIQSFDCPQREMRKFCVAEDPETVDKLNNYHFIVIYSWLLDMLFDIFQYQYADVEEGRLCEIFERCTSFINKPYVPVELTRNAISVLLAFVRRCKRFPSLLTDGKLEICEKIQ